MLRQKGLGFEEDDAVITETDTACRRCGLARTKEARCQCGAPFWEKESDLQDTVEVPREMQNVLVKAAQGEGPLREVLSPPVLPLTIDPVSMKSDSLPLNAAWGDEADPN